MVVFSIKVSNSNPATIVIGRRGTYNTQEVTFDLSYLVENYGNGTAVLMLKRSQDISAYPAVASQADNVLTWTVSDADTYYVGNGEAQLMWYVNDGLAKTIIYPMVVMRDIIGTTEDPPSGYENWIEHLVDLGEETLENAQAAEQSATNAANSAVEADNSATSAETSATTAEAAKDAAELYKNGAETAKTAAETAQSNAEIAQGKAEDAQASAEDSADRAEAALVEFTTPTASATTLSPDASATASYANGHFTFGIPKGNKGDPGDPGDPGVTPDFSIGTVETLQPTQPATASVTGTPEHPVLNLGIPKGAQGDPATNLVQSVNGKTGAVVLDSGDIAYESTTVEEELGTINSALTSLSSVTEIIDTASGAIASFPDGSGLPMRSLVAEIEPVQDLHGQDAPYPAGGGKNKLYPPDITWKKWRLSSNAFTTIADSSSLISFTIDGENITITLTTTYAGIGFVVDASSSERVVSVTGSIGGVQFWSAYEDGATRISTGTTSCTIPANTSGFIAFRVDSSTSTTIKAQLESGSTASAWSPYSNICPISGWTGVSGEVAGVNQWDEDWRSGYYNQQGTFFPSASYVASKLFKIKPNTGYSFVSLSKFIGRICYYDLNQQFISSVVYASNVETFPFTTPSNAYYMAFDMTSGYGGTYKNDISINYPSTDTSYHAYTGEAISVSWQDTAGTVYGGSDEVVGGNGTSTMAKVVFDGTQATTDFGVTVLAGYTQVSYVPYISGGMPNKPFISSIFKSVSSSEPGLWKIWASSDPNASRMFFGLPTTITTSADVLAFFRDNNAEVVYYKAQPQTFTHEGQSVDTLVGQNNVFVDTGDVTVTYQASIKGYIDKVLGS